MFMDARPDLRLQQHDRLLFRFSLARWLERQAKQQHRKKRKKMKSHRTIQAGAAGLLMAAASFAATLTFSTNTAGTGFGGSNLALSNSAGAAATLTFLPNISITTGVPSNVNFGNFTLACPACSTQALNAGSSFSAFTFDLVIADLTNAATGRFVGTSTGGVVFSDVSQIALDWAPLQLGPGASNALTGSFGTAIFSTTVLTSIVAPNSGAAPGQSTVEGAVAFFHAPEPATLGLIGAGLLALGLCRRRK